MRKIVFVILAVLSLAACKTTYIDTDSGKADAKGLAGKWRWSSSTGGIAGITIRATEARRMQIVEFNNNEVKFTVNDSVQWQAPYQIKKINTIFSPEPKDAIVKTNDTTFAWVIMKLSSDSLVFADNVHDGFSHAYVKEKN